MDQLTKECKNCWVTMPLDKFYHDNTHSPAYGSYCKKCTNKARRPKRISEREFTKQVIDLAHLHKWYAAHFKAAVMPSGRWATPVQGDGKGFPDLILVREPFDLPHLNVEVMTIQKAIKDDRELPEFEQRPTNMKNVLVTELKVCGGELSDEQIKWLLAFNHVGIPAYVWTPDDMDEIARTLRGDA